MLSYAYTDAHISSSAEELQILDNILTM